MQATVTGRLPRQTPAVSSVRDRIRDDAGYQAFLLLRVAFTVAPILFGIDKFFNLMVNWESYLAPWIRDLSPLSASHTMHIVGVIEIVAGIAVAVRPRYGAYWSPRGWPGSSSTCSRTRVTTTSRCATSG